MGTKWKNIEEEFPPLGKMLLVKSYFGDVYLGDFENCNGKARFSNEYPCQCHENIDLEYIEKWCHIPK